MIVAFHWSGVSFQGWPIDLAIPTTIRPEIINLKDKANIGGASATIIRADVKADDQISANAKPAKIARTSIKRFFHTVLLWQALLNIFLEARLVNFLLQGQLKKVFS